MALDATSGDPLTIQSLDAAAEIARMRKSADRRRRATRAGDRTRRRHTGAPNPVGGSSLSGGRPGAGPALLEETVEQGPAGILRAEALSLLAVVRLYEDGFLEAATLLERGLGAAAGSPALRLQMLVTLSFALFNAGQPDAALRRVEDAVTSATRLGQPNLAQSGARHSGNAAVHTRRRAGPAHPATRTRVGGPPSEHSDGLAP